MSGPCSCQTHDVILAHGTKTPPVYQRRQGGCASGCRRDHPAGVPGRRAGHGLAEPTQPHGHHLRPNEGWPLIGIMLSLARMMICTTL